MKRTILIFAIMAAAIALATDSATLTLTGGTAGRAFTVTTNGVRVALSDFARLASVSNAGTNVVYVAPRVSAAEFAVMVAATNATPVAGATSYEFVGGAVMDSITMQTASGESLVYLGVQK